MNEVFKFGVGLIKILLIHLSLSFCNNILAAEGGRFGDVPILDFLYCHHKRASYVDSLTWCKTELYISRASSYQGSSPNGLMDTEPGVMFFYVVDERYLLQQSGVGSSIHWARENQGRALRSGVEYLGELSMLDLPVQAVRNVRSEDTGAKARAGFKAEHEVFNSSQSADRRSIGRLRAANYPASNENLFNTGLRLEVNSTYAGSILSEYAHRIGVSIDRERGASNYELRNVFIGKVLGVQLDAQACDDKLFLPSNVPSGIESTDDPILTIRATRFGF